jgi:hypothetical protein
MRYVVSFTFLHQKAMDRKLLGLHNSSYGGLIPSSSGCFICQSGKVIASIWLL